MYIEAPTEVPTMAKEKEDCVIARERYNRAHPNHLGEGHFVSAGVSALAHLCEMFCRADLSNQPGTVRAVAAVIDVLDGMGRGTLASEYILAHLGARPEGGRGTELLEKVTEFTTRRPRR